MQEFYLIKIDEVQKRKEFLEKQLKVKIEINERKVTIEGESLEEYEASLVFEALIFGFSIDTSILLKDPAFTFTKIPIKDFTRKKNLEPVRARLIGKHGKTRKTVEEISGCKIKIKGSTVGIIGPSEGIEYAVTAITNLIKGAKQSNVYGYLEKINRRKRKNKE